MFKRTHYIALALVLLIVAVIFNLPSQAALRLKLALGGLFLAPFGFANSTHSAAERVGDTIVPRKILIDELERLRRENQELKIQVEQDKDILRENERLRQAVAWQKRTRFSGRLARVIGRDPSNWWRTIQIDLGSRDKVQVNMSVITTDGLVGRVAAVGYSRSQVALVGDPNCRVAAMVQKTRESGVVVPSGAEVLEPNIVELTYMTRSSKLEPDQAVVTSGLGGVFPPGILIGTIVDSRTVDYGLYTEARVKLAVNLNRLEEVWVIVNP